MKRAVRTTGHNHRIGIQDAESLLTVLTFSLTGLLGCLVLQAPLDGPAFALVRLVLILASAPSTALTGLVFGGGE
jgi:hypothetical protein